MICICFENFLLLKVILILFINGIWYGIDENLVLERVIVDWFFMFI